MTDDLKTTSVQLRTTLAERDAIRRIAASHGLTISDYARARLLPSRQPEPYQPRFDGTFVGIDAADPDSTG